MLDEAPSQPQTVVNVNMTNTNTATAKAAAAAAGAAPAEESKSPPPPTTKSLLNAYLSWALLGLVGVHRSDLDRPTWVWLALLWGQAAFAVLYIANPLFFIGAAALFAADAFEIPGWVRQYNQSVAASIGAAKAKEEKAQDLRTLLLHAAHQGDGRLTVTQAVMASGQDWDRVEGCLRGMVQAGYVDVDNEPNSGVIVYLFPELVGRPALAEPGRPPDGRLVS